MKIADIKDKMPVDLNMLVVQCKHGVTNASSPYLSITFRDSSGSIEGKLWTVKDEHLNILQQGKIVEVKADALLYRNNLQLKISDVAPVDQSTINMQDFVLSGPYDTATLKKGINEAINSITNVDLQRIVKTIYEKYDEQVYVSAAAARNHHEYYGGLATHVYSMLKLADMFCQNYPYLNRNLLIAGVLLHDIGKVLELSSNTVTEYTLEGKLIGHISISQTIVKETADQLGIDSEAVTILRHMILSHHGQYEFGSPVLPMTIEAEALHFIDDMDAKMTMVEKELHNLTPGEFSLKNYALDNKSYYKHGIE